MPVAALPNLSDEISGMAITFGALLLFTAMLQAVVAQQMMRTTVAPYVIIGNGTSSCPSQTERESVHQSITSTVRSILLDSANSNCGPGQWHRVAFLNMSDPLQRCPFTWREYSANGVRACGRPPISSASCSSANYFSNGRRYSRVCGQAIGYQIGSTDTFFSPQRTIDGAYVNGLSVTHGVPRTHIWTFAAGLSDNLVPNNEIYSCPCLLAGTSFTPQTPPSFVGDDYYCESGNPTFSFQHTNSLTYTNDPLWDGQQCEGQCCSNGKSPPWFSVELPAPTTDDIQVRVCGTEQTSNEDTAIKLLEIFVQ